MAARNVTGNYSISFVNGFFTVGATAQAPEINYGAFVLSSTTYPDFDSRMAHTHYLGVPTFRYNYDYAVTGGYRVDDIINDGLRVALTFNHKSIRLPYFPRGTEIDFYASKLDSLLKLPDKPDLVALTMKRAMKLTGRVRPMITCYGLKNVCR